MPVEACRHGGYVAVNKNHLHYLHDVKIVQVACNTKFIRRLLFHEPMPFQPFAYRFVVQFQTGVCNCHRQDEYTC